MIGLFTPSSSLGDREERQSIGLTALLAQSVMLTLVATIMPASIEQFPDLGLHRLNKFNEKFMKLKDKYLTIWYSSGTFMCAQCMIIFAAAAVAALILALHTRVVLKKMPYDKRSISSPVKIFGHSFHSCNF